MTGHLCHVSLGDQHVPHGQPQGLVELTGQWTATATADEQVGPVTWDQAGPVTVTIAYPSWHQPVWASTRAPTPARQPTRTPPTARRR